MPNQKAAWLLGGLVVGTVAAGAVSLVCWSVVPTSVWAISCALVGNQAMNLKRHQATSANETSLRPQRMPTHPIPATTPQATRAS